MWLGPDDHKVVGAFLADVRRDAGVTQDELSARLRKPQSFVSSYERGQRRIDFLEFTTIILALERDPLVVGTELLEKVTPQVRKARGRRKR